MFKGLDQYRLHTKKDKNSSAHFTKKDKNASAHFKIFIWDTILVSYNMGT